MCSARAQSGAVFGRPQLPEGSSVQPGCNWRLLRVRVSVYQCRRTCSTHGDPGVGVRITLIDERT